MSFPSSTPIPIPKEIPDVIGIKFGSRNTVLGIVKNHAVDTLNLSKTDNVIEIEISFLKNFSSTYTNLNRLIGLKYESNEFFEHEKKFMFFNYEFNNDIKEYLYDCQIEKKLPIENIIASFFSHCPRRIVSLKDLPFTTLVRAFVPDFTGFP